MTIVFSILRNIALTFLLWFSQVLPPPAGALNPLAPLPAFDVFVVDQQSVCVPFLRLLTGTPVVFYCHFPDKLLSGGWQITFGDEVNLSRNSGGLLKKAYRWPIDTLEEWTTADVILANSKFTSRVYSAAFSSLRKRQPSVVYPCIDVDAYQGSSVRKGKAKAEDGVDLVVSERPTVISFNRFEAKKNVALAIESFADLKHSGLIPEGLSRDLRFVVGGGYDSEQTDNVETLRANQALCEKLGLSYHTLWTTTDEPAPEGTDVLFVLNFSTAQRSALLLSPHTLALLYTPTNEHFGIVPIEAMACGLPVLACNTGGPTETVVDFWEGATGFLRAPKFEEWAPALARLVSLSDDERRTFSAAAKKRVREQFSLETLGREMDLACREAVKLGNPQIAIGNRLIKYGLTLIVLSLGGLFVALKFASP
ncbi:glycolipid mannosyltransferase [Trichosporon asahii var. asahii CBS 2479]|uniref:Alpha-1,3/1,6-mannosyltransferase ALG2 n=1 Tax=Trichosporon asahii var. asahii (strain ATCC 90039 / CBS 2479 / JCM 2466 / KCTC 7840 / NBRC 103889/ NCYC 2677 / UAMH 7654) TaxID=1186058 RepID=J5T513_TRIAS|nr:glycolipid mannosyltransferase [Trichosporon asahii var. asahii CBS 2479]EJT49211.1 glycolipid mannosyltransferase [Trichosporon asahii var. asahii CBS 2479]